VNQVNQQQQHLRMSGKVWERLAQMAQDRIADQTRPPIPRKLDEEIADALSRPKAKRRGVGYSMFIRLDIPQVERLAGWIGDDQPRFMREYRTQVEAAVRQHREAA
jgi:hypothetical protein